MRVSLAPPGSDNELGRRNCIKQWTLTGFSTVTTVRRMAQLHQRVCVSANKTDAGIAVFGLGGRKAPSAVLVADIVEPILGAETLDAIGLAL
jgi:hypothetical protein